ncbi:MAG: hypothetical protein KGL26_00395, partial [Pseudomonadota bacterium]|nr:hypothetical protein [Pseudomonadota bacterium]
QPALIAAVRGAGELLRRERADFVIEVLPHLLDALLQHVGAMVGVFDLASEPAQGLFEIAHPLGQVGDGGILGGFALGVGGFFLVAGAKQVCNLNIAVMGRRRLRRCETEPGKARNENHNEVPMETASEDHLASLDQKIPELFYSSRTLCRK